MGDQSRNTTRLLSTVALSFLLGLAVGTGAVSVFEARDASVAADAADRELEECERTLALTKAEQEARLEASAQEARLEALAKERLRELAAKREGIARPGRAYQGDFPLPDPNIREN